MGRSKESGLALFVDGCKWRLSDISASYFQVSALDKQKERMGLRENLVRFSVGIEALDDIIADIQQALA